MMEDWTDIIGEELENIEEPLPADDWSVLQQKYAAAQRKKKAAAFAWAGGITSIAAAVALVLLLVRPDAASVNHDLTASAIPEHTVPVIPEQTSPVVPDIPGQTSPVDPDPTSPVIPDPIGDLHDSAAEAQPQTEAHAPVDVVKNTADDVLIAEDRSDEAPYEEADEIFDVIRDTTSLKDRLLADASTTNRKDAEDEYASPTGSFGFDDFPDDEPRRKRRPMSIGISGSASDSPIMKPMGDLAPEPPMGGDLAPEPPMDPEPPKEPEDSLATETPQPAMAMMRAKSGYSDSYQHEIPVSVGLSARFFLTDRLSINTGLNYTRYKSLRTRWFAATHDQQKDWQYAHYIGVPVRLDYNAVNRKHFNLYFGAGLQMDKCVYATVGDERLHEKQILFGLNGAMGLQVNIVPMVGIYFEPEVSYSLNKGSIETFRSDEPFVVTVRGGLRFNF